MPMGSRQLATISATIPPPERPRIVVGVEAADEVGRSVSQCSGGVEGATVSIQGENHNGIGETLEEPRAKVLATTPVFPGYHDLVIDDLTDEEEAEFLAALADA